MGTRRRRRTTWPRYRLRSGRKSTATRGFIRTFWARSGPRRASQLNLRGGLHRRFAMAHEVVDGRRKDQRKNHGAEQTADDGDGERLQHLRTGANAESEGQHSGDGGESGHGDGAKAAAAGLNHGVVRRHAGILEMNFGVEKKDAVFGDDADHHDHAHEGCDVEGRARDQKRGEAAEGGKNGGGENGGWRGERAEFEQKHGEKQKEREEKDLQKFLEGLLLLLELTAVFDAD